MTASAQLLVSTISIEVPEDKPIDEIFEDVVRAAEELALAKAKLEKLKQAIAARTQEVKKAEN